MREFDHELGTIRVLDHPDDDLGGLWDLLGSKGTLSLDTETTGLDIYGEGFAVRTVQVGSPNLAYVIPMGGGLDRVARDVVTADRHYWLHNRVYDGLATERSMGTPFGHFMAHTADTMILAKLLDPRGKDKGGAGHGLKDLADEYLGLDVKDARSAVVAAGRQYKIRAEDIWRDIPLTDETYLRYAGQDVLLGSRLADELVGRVRSKELGTLVKFEHELDYALAHVQRRGIRLDVPYTESVRDRYLEELNGLETALRDDWGVSGTGAYMHKAKASLISRLKELGVKWEGSWLTPKGNEKLDRHVLKLLAQRDDEAGELAKVVTSAQHARHYGLDYAGGFLEAVGYDGRVHPVINPLAAATGRMSISNPPLQQIPKDDVMVRGCYLADEGEVLVGADYAQVEYRVAAAISGDEGMKAAINAGQDLHGLVAATLFGEGWEPRHRDLAKGAGFGRLYGAGVATIAKSSGVDEKTAKEAVQAFDSTYPGVRAHAQRLAKRIQSGEQLTTVTGRPLILDPERGYAAINYAVQSPSRDIFAQGILNMSKAGILDKLRLVVHDEAIVSCKPEEAEEVGHEVERCMSTRFLGVPIETEAAVLGERWTK